MTSTPEKRDPVEPEKRDPPGKPFRTPGKNKTHPAPETATDGHPPRKDEEREET
jgi:hypothetical protein